MLDNKTVLAVIAARGGSKGLPGKNLAEAVGKPVIAWSIESAKQSQYIDRLILSSDDADIISVAESWGCEAPFVRPKELAGDTAKIEDALIHALDAVQEEYDYLVLLQATSPLRAAEDIDSCLEMCRKTGAPACVSVTLPDKSPYWMYRVAEDGRMQRLLDDGAEYSRRQDLPPVYAINGAVYVAEVPWFKEYRGFVGAETRAHVMPPERSVDIDERRDLLLLRALLGEN
jgi:N-acylneuraminate cytidylyltransferase